MRPLPAVAAAQCGVFSTHQGRREGWTPDAFRHAARTGRIVRVRVGAYQAADLDDIAPALSTFERARWRHAAPAVAAVLTTRGAWASHSTAAVLRGIPLLYLPDLACLSV